MAAPNGAEMSPTNSRTPDVLKRQEVMDIFAIGRGDGNIYTPVDDDSLARFKQELDDHTDSLPAGPPRGRFGSRH